MTQVAYGATPAAPTTFAFTVGSTYDAAEGRSTTRLCRMMCEEAHMATNLSLDPKLIERALELSGEKTKKAAVTRALEEFIARRRQKALLDLMGKLEWDTALDYKKDRSRG